MGRSNVWSVASDHVASFRSSSGNWDGRDIVFQIAVPVLTGLLVWYRDPTITGGDVGALLAVVSIFTGLLFQLLLSVLSTIHRQQDRAATLRNRMRMRSYNVLLSQLDADIAYAVLVGIAIAGGLAAALLLGVSEPWIRRLGTAAIAAALMHFGLTLLMVLKRYRAVSRVASEELADDFEAHPRRTA